MTNIMIDLETLGTSPFETPPGVTILSIGAVVFDYKAPNPILETFYQEISTPSCTAYGLKSSDATVAWWKRQAPEAQQLLVRCQNATDTNVVSLPIALERFRNFLLLHRSRALYAKGGSFEYPILRAAFRAAGITPPWNYWDEMCIRSLMRLFHSKPKASPHNALDDARQQALWLCNHLRTYYTLLETAHD